MHIYLGNTAAKEAYRDSPDGPLKYRKVPGNQVTQCAAPHGKSLTQVFTEITHPSGMWAQQSFALPAWVVSDSPAMELMIAEHFGCPIGVPKDGWTVDGHATFTNAHFNREEKDSGTTESR
jgi:hypothetical protein